jgi:hypothetical protein
MEARGIVVIQLQMQDAGARTTKTFGHKIANATVTATATDVKAGFSPQFLSSSKSTNLRKNEIILKPA